MPVSAYNPNTSTRVATRNADGDVVRYTYDVFGNKTTMTTYRNESLGPSSGDVTTWRYDEASNCMTNKVYADGGAFLSPPRRRSRHRRHRLRRASRRFFRHSATITFYKT